MLTQADADALLALAKRFEGPPTINLPVGADDRYDMVGGEREEEAFVLDVWRGRRRAVKMKFQTRGRNVVVLARLDLHGAPHTNPDGEQIGGTHLHLFREGFDAKWAFPLDIETFRDPSDFALAFNDFCRLCRVENPPVVQQGML